MPAGQPGLGVLDGDFGKKKCFNLENCVSGNKNMEGEHKIVVKVLPNLIPLCLNFSI